MKTPDIKTPMDAYLRFLWSVSEKDLESAHRIRSDIKLNRRIASGTEEEKKWRAFDEITSNNRRYQKLKIK